MIISCRLERTGIVALVLVGVSFDLGAGCASHPDRTASEATQVVPAIPDQPPAHFAQSPLRMSRVISEAMDTMGCVIKADLPAYRKGRMPWGEIVEIFLKPAAGSGTDLWVDTSRTFIGGGLQADRRTEILNAIQRALDRDLSQNPDERP